MILGAFALLKIIFEFAFVGYLSTSIGYFTSTVFLVTSERTFIGIGIVVDIETIIALF